MRRLPGRARLGGGLFSAHVLRRPAASSPFTSLRRVPRLAVPRMACWLSTFAFGSGTFWGRALASTGHRGRVDARGLRSGRAPGPTRTAGRGAGAPSRDRRPRRLRRRGPGTALRDSRSRQARGARFRLGSASYTPSDGYWVQQPPGKPARFIDYPA